MSEKRKNSELHLNQRHIGYHIIMIVWSFIAMAPVWILIINTLKTKKEIYTNPFGVPRTWTLENYKSIMSGSDFINYFKNSFVVVVGSLAMILVLGSLAAYALAHWRSKTSKGIHFFFIIGMMLPIKIATIRLIQIMKTLGTLNSLFSLYPVYIAMGLPTAIMGMIVGIFRPIDMIHTALNVTGDVVSTLAVARMENMYEDDTAGTDTELIAEPAFNHEK